MRGEPLVVVEAVRQLHELAHVDVGQLALQQRLLQVQLGVSGGLALALLAPRLPETPQHAAQYHCTPRPAKLNHHAPEDRATHRL